MKRKRRSVASIIHGKSYPTPLFTVVLSRVLVSAFVVAGPASRVAQSAEAKSCLERTSVQAILRQAEDPKQSTEARRRAYEDAVRFCSHERSIYAALTALLLEQQDPQKALSWARRGLEVAPEDSDLEIYEGVALLLLGQPDQAVSVLKATPQSGKDEFYLGMGYRALRAHKESQQALLKAFALGFNDPYLLYVLIEQDKALGDKDAGLKDFRTLYERFPDSPWLHMLYGDAYLSKHDDTAAQAEYEQVAKIAPNLPTVEYQLGYIDFERANYAAAEGHFRKEIATDPSLAAAYLYLGTTLRRLGRNSEALPFLAQAVMRDPNYILAYNELATSQIEAGKLEDALRTLQKGEKRFPQETAFPVQLAGLLRRLGRSEEAKREAKKATRLNNQNKPPTPGVSSGPGVPFLPWNEFP
jgi:tetratricopeptide (TPR) repeat protein